MTTRRAAAQRLKRNEALQELGEMAEQGDFDCATEQGPLPVVIT
ncbi:hypothetical protein [Nocardia carnea]|nr:hypothetical protein [Nocardia carnea]